MIRSQLPFLRLSPEGGEGGSGGAPGSGHGSNAGGQQGAVTPEQLQAFEQRIATMVSGAIDGRINRLGLHGLSEQLAALNARFEGSNSSGQGNAGRGTGTDGSGKSTVQQLQTELDELKNALKARDTKLLQLEKTAALRTELVRRGVRPGAALDDAVAILAGREDVAQNSEGAWTIKGKSDLGYPVSMPLTQGLGQWLEGRQHLLPPVPGSGSGAAGSTPHAIVGGRPKSLSEMTAEEAASLSPEQQAKLYESTFKPQGGGFFS